ncbi:MAG: four helix bundle protein [Anaerolineae bacterium]|nr:four helix bundle protein [Anaerolineae bacterium]
MNYAEWAESVPQEIKNDALWTVEAYRLALFAADIGWRDVTKLMRDRRTLGLSDQLYRALGSISANVAEGYSRGTGRDRARFVTAYLWPCNVRYSGGLASLRALKGRSNLLLDSRRLLRFARSDRVGSYSVSMNTPSVRPGRAAIGTTKAAMCWGKPSLSIVCTCLPRLSACS